MRAQAPILVRVFVEVTGRLEAEKAAAQLVEHLASHGTAILSPVRQYAKIPAYYEITIRVDPRDPGEGILEQVAQGLGTGWDTGGSTWKVWNHGPDNVFAVGTARWAQVEVLGSA